MTIRTVLSMCLMLALLGCSKLTLDNYNKISIGMDYDDVTRLIGPPAHCDDVMGMRSCQWGGDGRSADVNFVGGKVLIFSSHDLK